MCKRRYEKKMDARKIEQGRSEPRRIFKHHLFEEPVNEEKIFMER